MEEQLDSLDDLIRCLEEEQRRLKKCIEEASEEWEFGQAKSFAKAHNRIGERLRVLKNFRDPNLDERAYLYRRLISLEEEQKEYAKFPSMVTRFQTEIDAVNRELDRLENMLGRRVETQYIDDALFDLVEGKIVGFKLHLNKKDALVFSFTCSKDQLLVSFTYKKGAIWPSHKKRLRQIGFTKVQGERKFTREINVSQLRDAQHIKQFLAVSIYEGLDGHFIESPELEIIHRP